MTSPIPAILCTAKSFTATPIPTAPLEWVIESPPATFTRLVSFKPLTVTLPLVSAAPEPFFCAVSEASSSTIVSTLLSPLITDTIPFKVTPEAPASPEAPLPALAATATWSIVFVPAILISPPVICEPSPTATTVLVSKSAILTVAPTELLPPALLKMAAVTPARLTSFIRFSAPTSTVPSEFICTLLPSSTLLPWSTLVIITVPAIVAAVPVPLPPPSSPLALDTAAKLA